jgi:hypothetical protein
MKKLMKYILRFINEDCINIYLKFTYRNKIKRFLKSSDNLDQSFKLEIKYYWEKYNIKINTDWHKWYSSRNGLVDVGYIPEDLFYTIIEPYYNNIELYKAYSDKAIHNVWFPNVKKPVTLAKNINGLFYDDNLNLISYNEVIKRCLERDKIIIKPTIESGGSRNICFLNNKEDYDMEKTVSDKVAEFKENYIIQEVIKQHKDLKNINPESVNTIRAMSILRNNEVAIISPRLRMGVNGSKVDNASVGGLSCGIKEDGKLCKYAYDSLGRAFNVHPQGFVFENKQVPSYQKVIDIMKSEHKKFGHFKLISWDFAIDSDGEPLLIEINLRFQGINGGQLCNGPLFGDLTDDILEEVFAKKDKIT